MGMGGGMNINPPMDFSREIKPRPAKRSPRRSRAVTKKKKEKAPEIYIEDDEILEKKKLIQKRKDDVIKTEKKGKFLQRGQGNRYNPKQAIVEQRLKRKRRQEEEERMRLEVLQELQKEEDALVEKEQEIE